MNDYIRKLDGLGRIVIPKEFRKKIKIFDDDKLKISLAEEYIKIEKYSDIEENINKLIRFKRIIEKEIDFDILITDLNEYKDLNKEISKNIKVKINYGKTKIYNNEQDDIFNTKKNINIIVLPISIYGELIGAIIGYSYKREIDDLDKKILEIAVSILIKDIEE